MFAKFVRWRRFFGVDHVGGGAIAFFDDLAGELVAAAFACIDVNPGLGFEGFGDSIVDFLVLAVVERQGNRIGGLGEGEWRVPGRAEVMVRPRRRYFEASFARFLTVALQKLATMINDIVSQVRLWVGWVLIGGDPLGRELARQCCDLSVLIVGGAESSLLEQPSQDRAPYQLLETQKPAFAGLYEIQVVLLNLNLVPRRRLELPRPCGHQHLKLACLPISPSGHSSSALPLLM